ncbi:MAG: branched-chain amino acid ABC transporter permease [Rhodospirillaceae bacterium]|jgi:branched-chain amino acid transport system permease protein|nr:branched-chain amino acid ABC transporter permease [Rhodospirillaceae bacterium]MBT5244696.1 branched-chain amino acid ABC transporter permease [Rhodospirillaceae bacterium]MBT5562437.1 branched-chain amino acid ABC transporter permease [Rhodospirillaceae bacterium]MBT6242075.1 branched-chain amino acid ABC transporter permease [Rhodospirillaceae bacterium]MBT7137250.1 branched-chain amino acid ABC transporter permease [Rhodospirillaceae bacterium]
MNKTHAPHFAGVLLIAFFMAFPFVYTANDYPYIMHILITGFFYAILASSWTMLAGYAGQFSFGHMGFMAVGAYTTALFSHYIYLTPEPTNFCTEFVFGDGYLIILDPIGVTSSTLKQDCLRQAMDVWGDGVQVTPMPVWLGITLGTLMGGIFGFLIGTLVLPLRAAYLALFTLGFSEILRAAISAEIAVTRGQAGIELPALFQDGVTIFGHHYDKTDKLPPYFVMFFLLLICLGLLGLLAKSKFGLFVRALREDQDAAAALGVNTTRYKVMVFVITSMIAACGGATMAHYVTIISPNNLVILQMSLIVAMAVIGGVENIVAAAVGAILLEFLLEMLRNSFQIGPVEVDMTVWRLVIFGILLMLTLRFSPKGLLVPFIDYFTRGHIAKETVAKREQQKPDDEPGSETVN